MFYDDAFQAITESSAFSECATLTVDTEEYTLKGLFYSGNYGEKKLDKGYTTAKAVRRQAFQISKATLPSMLSASDLARRYLTVRGVAYVIREVTGNDSGMLVMELVPSGGDKT